MGSDRTPRNLFLAAAFWAFAGRAPLGAAPPAPALLDRGFSAIQSASQDYDQCRPWPSVVSFLFRYSRRAPKSGAFELAVYRLKAASSADCGKSRVSPGEAAQRAVNYLEAYQLTKDLDFARRAQKLIDDYRFDQVDWNRHEIGLGVSVYARAAQVLDDRELLGRAQKLAQKAARESSKHNEILAQGLIDLYETDFDPKWLARAVALSSSSFVPRNDYDQSAGIEALNAIRLARFTGREKLRKSVEPVLAQLPNLPPARPSGAAMLNALDNYLEQAAEIVIAGDPDSPETREMLRQVYQRYLPNKILILADGGRSQAGVGRWLPFIKRIRKIGGKSTAYVCVNYKCEMPTNDLQVLGKILDGKQPDLPKL